MQETIKLDIRWLKEQKEALRKNDEYITFLLYLLYENQKRHDRIIEHLERRT